jgi:hypothetical protein
LEKPIYSLKKESTIFLIQTEIFFRTEIGDETGCSDAVETRKVVE